MILHEENSFVMKLRLSKKNIIIIVVIILVISIVIYYVSNSGYSEISIPMTDTIMETAGTRYTVDFTADLITAVPVDYFFWRGGARIERPFMPPSRSTEIEFYVSSTGEVTWARLKGSSGDNKLDREIRDIVETWTYNPQAVGEMMIKIHWIKSTIEIFFDNLIFNYPNIKKRHPYIGQDISFRINEIGQPKYKTNRIKR